MTGPTAPQSRSPGARRARPLDDRMAGRLAGRRCGPSPTSMGSWPTTPPPSAGRSTSRSVPTRIDASGSGRSRPSRSWSTTRRAGPPSAKRFADRDWTLSGRWSQGFGRFDQRRSGQTPRSGRRRRCVNELETLSSRPTPAIALPSTISRSMTIWAQPAMASRFGSSVRWPRANLRDPDRIGPCRTFRPALGEVTS